MDELWAFIKKRWIVFIGLNNEVAGFSSTAISDFFSTQIAAMGKDLLQVFITSINQGHAANQKSCINTGIM